MELPQALKSIVDPAAFMPHGHCYFWKPGLIWLHVVSDTLIALAYYSIPLSLALLVRKRKDLPYPWMFVLFAVFIVSCGTTHLMEIWSVWHPAYWLSGGLKAWTGVISLVTAVLFIRMLPQALTLKSPAELAATNRKLEKEIAERRRTEDALRRTEERFRLVIENVQDHAIVMLDPNGSVVTWNAGAARIKGHRTEEIVGRHFSVFYTPEDVQAGTPARILEVAARTGKCEDEGWRLRKDGQRFWANTVITAIRDKDGNLIGFSKITRDMTERKLAEEMLSQKKEQLARSHAELEQLELFSYVATHDLREPLYKIISFGDLLKAHSGPSLNEKALKDLEQIQRAARRMDQMIEELREYSKIGKSEVPFASIQLKDVVKETLADLELRIQEAKAQVEVGPLPSIVGDRAQLRQLLQNLIGNAIKFRRPDAPCRIAVHGRALNAEFVEIVVEDNGIGFEEKYLDRIFKPFQRLHGRSEYEGSGLGLSICHKIAVHHGGNITATSKPGQGTTFRVTLLAHSKGMEAPA